MEGQNGGEGRGGEGRIAFVGNWRMWRVERHESGVMGRSVRLT